MDGKSAVFVGNSLQISTDAIAKIAKCAAMEIDGVMDIACGGQKTVRGILERVSIQQPVEVEIKDGTVRLTMHLMVAFGCKVPAVAAKVQENVKNAVQNMTGVTVSQVNVIVAGIGTAAQEV